MITGFSIMRWEETNREMLRRGVCGKTVDGLLIGELRAEIVEIGGGCWARCRKLLQAPAPRKQQQTQRRAGIGKGAGPTAHKLKTSCGVLTVLAFTTGKI